ncbi:MAG: hypothetical protein N3F03_03525 [Ignavibacteria bacterium]|nr:hypothetical protein [Ignavibacteria bacterium]
MNRNLFSVKTLIAFGFLILIFENLSVAQNIVELRSKYNSLEKFWVGTFEGGITYPFSDFQSSRIGYTARAGIEYYFPSKMFLTPGLRLHGYYGELNGESTTGRLSGDGSLIRMIKKFNTPFVLLEPSIAIALGKGKFIPYFSLGASYFIAFIPLERNGYSLFTNSKRDPFLTYSGEFGFRLFIHRDFSYNFSLKYFKGGIDELDGFVSRKNDSFIILSTGISIHLFRKERIR